MTAQLFRQSIAKSLKPLTQGSEAKITSLLGAPKSTLQHQFTIPVPKLLLPNKNANQTSQDLASKFVPTELIQEVSASGPFLRFSVNRERYVRHALQTAFQEQAEYGQFPRNGETVLLDYSSPNIAKPFHAGHLRSTILGQFLSNIYHANGFDTIRINYLGDWGKQFGLLAVGFEMFGNANDLKKDPIHHLYQVYVKINALAKQDESIDKKANAYFKAMEDGQPKILSQWKLFRELSIESYRDIYKRLNIVFDHYSGESETEPYISKVYHILEQYNLIDKSDLDGSLTINLEPYKLGKVKVKRADGTSLYITRDLASLMLRRERYPFNKAVYVIGTEQSLYMKQLFKISELIAQHDPSWPTDLHHANFGRVLGMSTRKGTVVFLQDILDNAKEAMLSTTSLNNQIRFDELAQLGISNTKEAIDYVADQLGSSAVIIQDMAAKRIKDYEFSWDRMVASKGNTGVYLQYTYARMCGIERKSDFTPSLDCDLSVLNEDEAFELALLISQFPDIVKSSCHYMEPCTIVQYLFQLSHASSQAHTKLRVKGADPEVAKARLLLFSAAKTTLGNGLKLLGIDPLSRM